MVECRICNKQLLTITESGHLKSHKLTKATYLELYPGAELISNETRLRNSAHAKRINAPKKGLKRDPDIRHKQSATLKRRHASGELQAWNKGLPMSDEQKSKLSEIATNAYANGERVHWNIGNICPAEVRKRISEGCIGYKFTDEQRQNLSIAMQELVSSPDYVNSMKGKKLTVEQCKRIGDATRRNYDQKRATMEAKGRWIPLDQLDDFALYKRVVWVETSKNVHQIPNYDVTKRGLNQLGTDHHQIDHIVSISDGFKHGVAPEVIGGAPNLRFIPWQENLEKWHRSNMSIEELYHLFETIL